MPLSEENATRFSQKMQVPLERDTKRSQLVPLKPNNQQLSL